MFQCLWWCVCLFFQFVAVMNMVWHLEIAHASYSLMVLKYSVPRIHSSRAWHLVVIMISAVVVPVAVVPMALYLEPEQTVIAFAYIVFTVTLVILPIMASLLCWYYIVTLRHMRGETEEQQEEGEFFSEGTYGF